MSRFGRKDGQSRAERSAEQRELDRLERERRRAEREGRTPDAPPPPSAPVEPPARVEPPAPVEPPPPPPPPPPPAPLEPPAAPVAPPVVPRERVTEDWMAPEEPPPPPPPPPVEPPTAIAPADDEPIGIRKVAAPRVRDLPEVRGLKPKAAPRPRRGARRAGLLTVLLLLAGMAWFANSLFQPFAEAGTGAVKVTIPDGSGAGEIGELLAEEGVVKSSFFFSLRTRISGDRDKLRSGSYTLARDMPYDDAITALKTAPKQAAVVNITIPEGLSVREIAARIKDSGLRGSYVAAARRSPRLNVRKLGAPKGTNTLEGFLFPATYELRARTGVGRLVADQLDAFNKRFEQLDLRPARRRNLTPYDIITIASMIEREAGIEKDRRLISAVIHNRLRQHMPLGIDATIRYRLNQWNAPLKVSELNINSAYNTRKRQGLPPTPIGNPGLKSIEAAIRPAKVNFVYYVVKPCGNGAHAFSASDAQFQRDVAAYNAKREELGGKDPSRC